MGINGGEVIVGDIGFRGHTVFTALGDSVNVAARLQDKTKELDCKVIVSEQVCQIAGIPDDALTRMDIKIRGRDESVTVRMAADPTILVNLLDSQSVNTEAELAEADIQG